MRIQLDTKEKTVRLEEKVNLDDLFKTLKKLLPNDEWKGFTLEINSTIVWTNPIIINPYIPINPYPWYNPTYITSDVGSYSAENVIPVYTSGYELSEGVFNIDIQ